MNTRKNLLMVLGEWWDERQTERRALTQEGTSRRWSRLLPTPGNILFTLLVVALLSWAQSVGALPLGRPQAVPASSTSTIAYQGRLADANGSPLTGAYVMEFRLYDVSGGGTPLWSETWTGSNSVSVSDGLFNIMLGSLNPIPQSVITGHSSLWLGITVGSDTEMAPRVQLGSVPFAVQALTVPDGSVTTAKIADSAVTQGKLADLAVTTAKLADGAVTQVKAPTLLQSAIGANRKMWSGTVTAVADTNGWIIQPITHSLSHVDGGSITPFWPSDVWYTGNPPTFGVNFTSIVVGGGLTPGATYTFSVVLIGE